MHSHARLLNQIKKSNFIMRCNYVILSCRRPYDMILYQYFYKNEIGTNASIIIFLTKL